MAGTNQKESYLSLMGYTSQFQKEESMPPPQPQTLTLSKRNLICLSICVFLNVCFPLRLNPKICKIDKTKFSLVAVHIVPSKSKNHNAFTYKSQCHNKKKRNPVKHRQPVTVCVCMCGCVILSDVNTLHSLNSLLNWPSLPSGEIHLHIFKWSAHD